jgi:hypothetical protein
MKKVSITVRLPHHLVERIRNACYATPGLSFVDFVDESLTICMDTLEEQNGGPFDQRARELIRGRRIQ